MSDISRRHFLIRSACLGMAAACAHEAPKAGPLALGPISKFSDGKTVLDVYRVEIIRSGSQLRALSLLCTHQTCLVRSEAAGYTCPCHGSEFDGRGERLSGPAPRSLPWFELSVDGNGELLLHRDKVVDANWSLVLN